MDEFKATLTLRMGTTLGVYRWPLAAILFLPMEGEYIAQTSAG